MERPFSRIGTGSLVLLFVCVSAFAGAQGRKLGEVTDEWGNGLVGVTVVADPEGAGGARQTTATDNNGEFIFLNLSSGDWAFTATLDGYQGLQQVANVTQTGRSRPLSFEMPVLASGGRFRERTEFEAEGGTPKFRFEEDGKFEFEDEDGDGEGTYGIVGLSAVLIVRDYDGPDDKFTLQMPVVVEFANDQFTSLTHAGVELPKR